MRAASVPGRTAAEPAYRLLHLLDEQIEIGRYPPCAVAEVFITGAADAVAHRAHPIVAACLAGENLGEQTVATTAPVTHTALDGGTLVRFVLPAGASAAPKPTNSRVVRRTVAGHTLAAIRYAGRWSPANEQRQLERLTEALRTARMAWDGEPRYARYHTTRVPWFLRRNEVWLRLA